jgi:hypothetical protein
MFWGYAVDRGCAVTTPVDQLCDQLRRQIESATHELASVAAGQGAFADANDTFPLEPAGVLFFAERGILVDRFLADFLRDLCAPIDDDTERCEVALAYCRLWEDAHGH